ncbi:hypothetical protein EPN96_06655 [bacterium]|nr:MAG: hypothetical protein EPN96_06655 [bacterium]
MGNLSAHFSREEFACPCGCGLCEPKKELVDLLEEMRKTLGAPVRINSGLRCEAHNQAVGGKDSSAHLCGEAADVSAEGGEKLFSAARAGFLAGAKRIGIGKNFVHVDVSGALPSPRLWTY